MKKMFASFLVLSVLILTGCTLKGSQAPEPEPQRLTPEQQAELEPAFESVDYGFSVKGPDGWVKQPDKLGMLVTYVKPGDPEVFQENITVARELKGNLDLATYTQTTLEQMAQVFAEFKINEQKSVQIKGQTAERLGYQITQEGRVLQVEQLIVERPTEFLVLTYMANVDQFQVARPAFSGVVSSLKFFETEAAE